MIAGAAAGGAAGVGVGIARDAKYGNNGRWVVDGFAGAVLGFFGSCVALAGVAAFHLTQSPGHHKVIYEDDGPPPAKG